MATYEHAPQIIHDLIAEIVDERRQDLSEAEVTFLVLMARAPVDDKGRRKGPALKHHGYAAAGLVKVLSLKDRVAGLPDVRIELDGDRWEEFSASRQKSILEHELMHVAPTGETDDAGRPKLRLRLHDVQVGGFHEIIDRYGEDSCEAELLKLAGMRQQFLFSDLETPTRKAV